MSALQRRHVRFDDWPAVQADAGHLLAQGYDQVGQWSLGQVCHHLAVILDGAIDGYPEAWTGAKRWVARRVVLPRMLKHKPTGLRVSAPAFAQPVEAVDDASGLKRMNAAIARFTDPQVTYADHLVFGPLSRDQWKHQQLWHCEHHLSFLLPRDEPR